MSQRGGQGDISGRVEEVKSQIVGERHEGEGGRGAGKAGVK